MCFLKRASIFSLVFAWCTLARFAAIAADPPKFVPASADPPELTLPTVADPAEPATGSTPPALLPPDKSPPMAPSSATPSQNVTINLINRLVQRGVLTQADAAELIKQAEEDAVRAKAQAEANAPEPASDDAVRVTYIPDNVKSQIRDELKDEVLAQARAEHWAAPDLMPDWARRFRFFGDIRVRYQGNYFPTGNDNTGAYPNFNAINTGAPFDVSGTVFSPQYNVDQDRQRLILRARFGMDVNLDDGFTAGFRIGTGSDNSPVTQNQTLGVANNGQGGNFSKYAVWLDRGFIRWDVGGRPDADLSITAGRFDNPFFTTSRIVWENDIGFDGVVLAGKYEVLKGVTPFFATGIFPVFNTDFNFSTIQPAKFESTDKWLNAVQFGVDLKADRAAEAKVAVAYYEFRHVEGKLSDPFVPLTAQDQGNTDDTRPSFAQNGNTYMALRNIVPDALNNFGTSNQFQYFGLATPFHVLEYNARIDLNFFEPWQITLLGDYAKNLALDRSNLDTLGINNRGPNGADGSLGNYAGGDTAWFVGLQFGKPVFEKFGDWNVTVGYRHVESDAVIDGFNDSDFGSPLTGTNLKGYTVGAAMALSPRVKIGVTWMGANSIVGPEYKSDLLQLDLSAKF
jgi:hypothetical protein